MLIGIGGKKGSGKDEAFKIIKKHYPDAQRIAFGDLLKKSICATLGITLEQFELMKNSPRAKVIVINHNGAVVNDLSIRTFIQNYGTEGHRMLPEFGNDFWVNLVLPAELRSLERLTIVTDVRFPNEAQRVVDLGGFIIVIDRDQDEEDTHVTEKGLDKWDYLIENNGTLEEYEQKVLAIMQSIMFREAHAHSH